MNEPDSKFLAVAPFAANGDGLIVDSEGDLVITCSDECPPCALYKEKEVAGDGWFQCPKCGRLGQRMEEASSKQVQLQP